VGPGSVLRKTERYRDFRQIRDEKSGVDMNCLAIRLSSVHT
jgi:hypothetical protein